jgi:hypothetical protein
MNVQPHGNKRARQNELDQDLDDSIPDVTQIIRAQVLNKAKASALTECTTAYTALHNSVCKYQDKTHKLITNNHANSVEMTDITPIKAVTPDVRISLPASLNERIPELQALYLQSARQATKGIFTALQTELDGLEIKQTAYADTLQAIIHEKVSFHYAEINSRGLVTLSDQQLQKTREQIYPVLLAHFIILDSTLTTSRKKFVDKRDAAKLARAVDEPMPAIDDNNVKDVIADQVRKQIALQLKANKPPPTKKPAKPQNKTKKQVQFKANPARKQGKPKPAQKPAQKPAHIQNRQQKQHPPLHKHNKQNPSQHKHNSQKQQSHKKQTRGHGQRKANNA